MQRLPSLSCITTLGGGGGGGGGGVGGGGVSATMRSFAKLSSDIFLILVKLAEF